MKILTPCYDGSMWGESQNAYHIGEIVSIFQIETTVKPAEHNVDLPILAEEARGAATIWVRRTILTIWVGTKILLLIMKHSAKVSAHFTTWRLCRLAALVFRSALTPEHAEGR
jgi:hypothetical protein